jgi:hypothetical protein
MRLVAGIHTEFCSTARQVYALEAARLSFMAQPASGLTTLPR